MKANPYKANQDRLEGRKYILTLAATVRAGWARACELDGVPADSTFVVFSDGNKVAPFYERAMAQYLESCRQYEAGGYVGVTLQA